MLVVWKGRAVGRTRARADLSNMNNGKNNSAVSSCRYFAHLLFSFRFACCRSFAVELTNLRSRGKIDTTREIVRAANSAHFDSTAD